MRRLLAAILIVTSLAGCLADEDSPTATDDATEQLPLPTEAGLLGFSNFDFEFETAIVMGNGPATVYPVALEGRAFVPEGDGPFPLVVLMHGRHGTCVVVGLGEILGTPCPDSPPLTEPVNSYTGYDYLAKNLASHGYLVASISANHVNDRDNDYGIVSIAGLPIGDDYGATARARIILGFLDDVAATAGGGGAPELAGLAGKADMSSIGLMGHSRGGEGVTRAIAMNNERASPHELTAVFALAPTDFARHQIHGVPFATLLPYCDADVSNLQGAWIFDDNRYTNQAPLHQFLALGANHNYYNTIWTNSDWTNRGDEHCDQDSETSGRDSPDEQREHGLAIMSAFLRAYVGGESGFMPYLTGQAPFEQPGIITSYMPGDINQRQVLADGKPIPNTGEGYLRGTRCEGTDCPIARTYSTADQWYAEGNDPKSYYHGYSIFHANLAWETMDALSLRLGIDHESPTPESIELVLRFHEGKSTAHQQSWNISLSHPPGETGAKTVLSTITVPLDPIPAGIHREAVFFALHLEGLGPHQLTDVILLTDEQVQNAHYAN